jgi:CDP-alcohol phosphatidyltransferase
MSSRAVHLVIDARPRGPRGLLAAELVLGRSVLDHLLDLAVELATPSEPVVVHARADDHQQLRELAGKAQRGDLVLVSGPPRADATVLRTDRFYDAKRLRRGLRRGRSPESAVLWRLDRPESLQTADEELKRRLTYQPLGKYWAFPLARGLAQVLSPTRVRPNHLTLTAAALMLLAAGSIAVAHSGWPGRSITALALALALVLDTADGRLARLQGTSSAFGRWLDQVLDELADLAIHAAVAWTAYRQAGQPIWLVLGMVYASGKYLFLVQSILGDELERRSSDTESSTRSTGCGNPPGFGFRFSVFGFRQYGVRQQPKTENRKPKTSTGRRVLDWLAGAARLMGHADVRWHLWIALALPGRLELALAAYAFYFPARALAGSVRKGVRYA